jgi:hypothetical protein
MPLNKFRLNRYQHQGTDVDNKTGPALDQSAGDVEEGIKPVESYDDHLRNTPFIPDVVISRLPDLLQRGCSPFQKRERDVFLTGALTILSGCFDNVFGQYDGFTVRANIYSLLVAGAANGKGSLRCAKDLANTYHSLLLDQNKVAKAAYQEALKGYHQKEKEEGDDNSKPEPPPFLQLLIPADSSAASLKETMRDTQGKGIICETEADTLADTLAQDWGNYSDLLRKAFHHEDLSFKRKTGREKGEQEYVQISNPCLSVALSGTYGQLLKLIPSAENGLFSRFIYYAFKTEAEWRDVSPHSGRPNLNDYFKNLSDEVCKMIGFFEKEEPFEFSLKYGHWVKLNQTFAPWLKQVGVLVSQDATSVIKRLGLITFRIAMILSILRSYQKGVFQVPIQCKDAPIECEDIDFDSALRLAETYKEHALIIFGKLPKANKARLDEFQLRYYNALPEMFKREQAEQIAAVLKIASRSVNNYLNRFIEGKLLEKEKHGHYKKLT